MILGTRGSPLATGQTGWVRDRLMGRAPGDIDIATSATPDQVATLLEEVWGGQETLVVVSSDLSHFLPYDVARRRDQATAQEILRLEPRLESADACGATPVNGLIEIARRRHLVPELVDLRNSGDTAGGRDRVVGYASFVFREPGDADA